MTACGPPVTPIVKANTGEDANNANPRNTIHLFFDFIKYI
jgi:hypothetical protein